MPKTACEAMGRLLLKQFIEKEDVHVADSTALIDIIQPCDREHHVTALNDPSILTLIERYHAFEDKVRKGLQGKTAAFWMTFIEHSQLVFMLLNAVKTNNLELFHKCNGLMAKLFFACDDLIQVGKQLIILNK